MADETGVQVGPLGETEATVKVGAFEYDSALGTITGPAAYLESDQYALLISRIRNGDDPCGAFRFSPTPTIALLVTIQTDYAGWHGMQTFNQMRGV